MISNRSLIIDVHAVAEKITGFIADQVQASGLRGAIVAVSGGIDSAVALSLTAKALGGDRVRAITMPERDITPEADITDVMRLAEVLDVTCDAVDITPMIRVMQSKLPLYDPSDQISSGNIRPRVRMVITYHYANILRSMVVGSTNRSEWLMGYFTKYGDGGADLMPLAGLYKTQIRQLARHLRIPKRIVEKTPTAGLWPGQSDEEEMGIKYDVLDLILYGWERGNSVADIADTLGVDTTTVERVLERVRLNEHKRRLPLILRLSSITG